MTGDPAFDAERARAEQAAMAHRVVLADDPTRPITRVCGVDLAYAVGSDHLVAAAVVLDRTTLAVLDEAVVEGTATVPYIPGLLSFREAPWALAAIGRLTVAPDLVVCDGQGIAHHDRFGLACHLGVALDLPSIGCAKTHYVGDYEEPGEERGDRSPLTIDGDVVGMVLRTRRRTKPLFVSPGHRITVATAADLVLELAPRYRQPETTRAADHLSREQLRRLTPPR